MEPTEKYIRRTNGREVIPPIKEKFYQMPTEVFFGREALAECAHNLIKKSKKIVLVTGEHFRNTPGYTRFWSELTNDSKVAVYGKKIEISDFESVNNLTDFVRKENPDLIIAVGGGTILDSAKCAAILAVHEGKVEDFVKSQTRKLEQKGIAFVAIPTTAGTGSEVTPWATVWDSENKDKYSLTDKLMFPDLAIVDPALTDSLGRKNTAESGIDALTQAIESYWSIRHNPVSDEFALEAIRLSLAALEKAVNSPDQASRDKMARASLLAGLSFSNTQTTICHAVSYPMTAYFGVAHGQAVSITLPMFIEFSLEKIEENRKKELLGAIGARNESEARKKIMLLMENCGLATKLSQLGIKKEDIDLIVAKGFHPERAKNAPRIPTPEDLKTMLISIL